MEKVTHHFDYVIVGAGPTGLTIAEGLSQLGYLCLVIEKNDVVGGCHVTFPHSPCLPLIYSKTFLNFRSLSCYNDDHFKSFHNNIKNDFIFDQSLLTRKEQQSFRYAIFRTILNPNYGRDQSCSDFFYNCDFSKESIRHLNALIRWISNGSDMSRFTLHDLLQLYNHRLLEQLTIPKLPNLMMQQWQTSLVKTRHVHFRLKSQIVKMHQRNKNTYKYIIIKNENDGVEEKIHIRDDIIFTGSIVSLEQFEQDIGGDFFKHLKRDWPSKHKSLYQPSMLFEFHEMKEWNKKKMSESATVGEWGLKYRFLSSVSQLIVTITNVPKKESDVTTISSEVIRQLKLEYGNDFPTFSSYTFIPYFEATTYSFVYNDSYDEDVLFMNDNNHHNNFFIVGPHTLPEHLRPTPFVSIETSIVSGLHFLQTRFPESSQLFPILKSKQTTIFQGYRYKLFLTVLLVSLLIVGLLVGLILGT